MEIHVDTVIRLMTIGGSMLLLLMILASNIERPVKIPLAGLLLGGAAYLLNSSTYLMLPRVVEPPIDLISIVTPFWTWLFARRLFERDPPRSWLIILTLLYVTGWAFAQFVPGLFKLGFYMIHITSLLLIADLIYVALSGFGDDLIAKRRLVRIYLPLLVGLQAGGILTFEMIFMTTDGFPVVQVINAVLIMALVLFGGLALLTTDPELLKRAATEVDEAPALPPLSPSEKVLHDKLQSAMDDGKYRETSLTIQTLAASLDTPEHRLRALINRKLGHRNFSSFLNRYRIDEAKQKLADRTLVDLPILTIAMDLGYGSLAPFNRAFRAETGQTPSDFRKQAIDQN